jgi:hypothetical protein
MSFLYTLSTLSNSVLSWINCLEMKTFQRSFPQDLGKLCTFFTTYAGVIMP